MDCVTAAADSIAGASARRMSGSAVCLSALGYPDDPTPSGKDEADAYAVGVAVGISPSCSNTVDAL